MMEEKNKIALLIIFNHRFDKNIPRLEEIYRNKFSNIFFVVPFYDGDKENVIPVYYNSFYFEGYIAQAYQHIKDKGFTHYFFVADDMIINPQITEDSIFNFLGITPEKSWIDVIFDCKTRPHHWRVPLFINLDKAGIEVRKMLPSVEDVTKKFDKYGLSYYPSRWYAFIELLKHLRPHRHCPKAVVHSLSYLFRFDLYELRKLQNYYPGIWGSADILLVPAKNMDKFAQYCGIFAGLRVFVETAIPYSLLLTSDEVVTTDKTNLKTVRQIFAMEDGYEDQFNEKYNFNLDKLLTDYPKDVIYIHPVKLSKWK